MYTLLYPVKKYSESPSRPDTAIQQIICIQTFSNLQVTFKWKLILTVYLNNCQRRQCSAHLRQIRLDLDVTSKYQNLHFCPSRGIPKGYSILIPTGWKVLSLCIHLNSFRSISDGFTTSRMPNSMFLSKASASTRPWSKCRCRPSVYRSLDVSSSSSVRNEHNILLR